MHEQAALRMRISIAEITYAELLSPGGGDGDGRVVEIEADTNMGSVAKFSNALIPLLNGRVFRRTKLMSNP